MSWFISLILREEKYWFTSNDANNRWKRYNNDDAESYNIYIRMKVMIVIIIIIMRTTRYIIVIKDDGDNGQ